MIDVTTKQPGGGERGVKMSQAYREVDSQARRKHDSINLPKNLMESDSEEDYEEECLSEADNDQFKQDDFSFNGTSCDLAVNKLSCTFDKMELNDKQQIKDEVLRKLSTLVKEYKKSLKVQQTESIDKDLKARSPYRNRANHHNRLSPLDRQDLTVTTAHGNRGRVIVQSLSPRPTHEPLAVYPDYSLLNAIQDPDFMESLKKLSADELEQILLQPIDEEDYQIPTTVPQPVDTQFIMPPMVYPQTQCTVFSEMSPSTVDMYDSSYETSSPCSTILTSLSSPSQGFSPPHTSLSCESDLELDPASENCTLPQMTNIVIVPTTVSTGDGVSVSVAKKSSSMKVEPTLKPLGGVVHFETVSASQRLYELSKSTSNCIKHFTIQLVRVVMTAKAEKTKDKIEDFCKSLLGTMKMKLLHKAHESDIWQLSILAHIQFLTAPVRVLEYQSALHSRDERGHSLLYIAAIERYEKPLIARYIAESMSQVGYSPLEVDDKGNTILHLVAMQGDSHVHVLSELLMAKSGDNKPLFSVLMTNNMGQSALHMAVQSPNPYLNTVLQLLRKGARPLDQDKYKKTALHYHVKRVASHLLRAGEDVVVIRKMLQAPVCLTKEALQTLELLCLDPSVPAYLSSIIHEYLKPKKTERR